MTVYMVYRRYLHRNIYLRWSAKYFLINLNRALVNAYNIITTRENLFFRNLLRIRRPSKVMSVAPVLFRTRRLCGIFSKLYTQRVAAIVVLSRVKNKWNTAV